MAGARLPVDVVKARGKKHLSAAEEEQRRACEIKAPTVRGKSIKPPAYLPENLKKKFRALAKQLIGLDILAEIDYDCLARYLLAEAAYLAITTQVNTAISSRQLSLVDELSRTQDRYFRQCDACAKALGLTISSRCRLMVPQKQESEDINPMFGD